MGFLRDRRLYGVRNLLAIAVAAALFAMMAPGESAGQTTAEPKPAAAPPSPEAIPPAEVATRAAEATNLLVALSAKFAPNPEIEKIQDSLAEVSRQIDEEFADTVDTLRQQPTLATLQAQQAHWHRRHLQVTAWLTLLTRRAVDLRDNLDRLAHMGETWARTRDAAQAESGAGANSPTNRDGTDRHRGGADTPEGAAGRCARPAEQHRQRTGPLR